jgi:Na+/pantothenate symporter
VSVLVILDLTLIALIALVSLLPGFLLGLLAFKVKSRWCPRCGEHTDALHRAVRR